MKIIEFFVPGTPLGKARARMCRNGHVYTPTKTVNYEQKVAAAYLEKYTVEKVHTMNPIELIINAVFPMPASWKRVKRASHADTPHLQRPDADNIIKIVCDALNGLAWKDDSCVSDIIFSKSWEGEVEQAGLHITIKKAEAYLE